MKRKPVTDDFEEEIKLQRKNKELMRFLDERGRKKATISVEEVRRRLALPPRNVRRKSGLHQGEANISPVRGGRR